MSFVNLNNQNDSDVLDLSGSLQELLNTVLRRRVIAFTTFLLVFAAGATAVMRAQKIYRATAKVQLDRRAPAILGHKVQDFDRADGYGFFAEKSFYKTQYQIIKSRPVAEKAAQKLGISTTQLHQQYLNALESIDPNKIDDNNDIFDMLPESLQEKLKLIGTNEIKAPKTFGDSLKELDFPHQLKNRVNVEPVPDSRLVEVSIEGPNPEQITILANTVAISYAETNLSQKRAMAAEAVGWLSTQVAELEEQLGTSEKLLHEFKSDHQIIAVSVEDRRSILSHRLIHLSSELTRITSENILLESQLEVLQNGQRNGTNLLNDAGGEHIQHLKKNLAKLQQQEREYSERYTSNHPKLQSVRQQIASSQKMIGGEIENLVQNLKHDYLAKKISLQKLKKEIESVKQTTLNANKSSIELSQLQRDTQNKLQLYNLVLKRQKEAELAQMLKANNVQVLEHALLPTNPIRPNRQVGLAGSLLFAIVLSIGLAVLADTIDNTVKSQHHIETIVGAPFLGILPTISTSDKEAALAKTPANAPDSLNRDLFIISNPRSSVAECSRTIRTNLFFMAPEHPAHTLVITSNGPQEGKSTVAINLGITIAQSGKKTLLVDADMRRPRLHKSFGVPNDTGLSSLIMGGHTIEQAVRHTEVKDLTILPCGPIPPNPAELLHTESFQKLVEKLTAKYDQVIFDSPPVSPVTDAMILGSMLDGVIFVAHAGKTRIPAAKQARRRLEDVGSRVLGAVLNNVDLEQGSRSGYYDYQYYYYHRKGYYYDETEDAAGSQT